MHFRNRRILICQLWFRYHEECFTEETARTFRSGLMAWIDVSTVKMAYRSTKNALEEVRRKQAEWDGVELSVELKTKTQRQKVSVL